MTRKMYSENYIKGLKKAAKRPADIENTTKLILMAMVDFIDSKALTKDFELYVKEHNAELEALLDEA